MDTFNKPPCPCAVERDFWAPTKERERGDFLSLEKKGADAMLSATVAAIPFSLPTTFPYSGRFSSSPHWSGLVCRARSPFISFLWCEMVIIASIRARRYPLSRPSFSIDTI